MHVLYEIEELFYTVDTHKVGPAPMMQTEQAALPGQEPTKKPHTVILSDRINGQFDHSGLVCK